jgi:hypothetical protein
MVPEVFKVDQNRSKDPVDICILQPCILEGGFYLSMFMIEGF